MRKLLLVAMFELRRNFSIRGELVGLLIVIVVVGIKLGGGALMNVASRTTQARIGVIANGAGAVFAANTGRLEFIQLSPGEVAQTRTNLEDRKLDGVLVSNADGSFTLTAVRNPSWKNELQEVLNSVVLKRHLGARGITMADLDKMHQAAVVHVVGINGDPMKDESSGRAVGLVVIVLSLVSFIGSFGIIFQIISGEKTDKVSDVVLSCVDSQAWIDGKVIAISIIGLKSFVLYGIYALVGARVFFSNSGLANSNMPLGGIIWTILFSVAGLVLWNCFFAAIASVSVGNEYSSDKRNLVLIPIVFYLIVFTGVGNPGNWFMQVLSWFPGSSMIAMPIRILAGDLPWWYAPVSFTLLLVSIYYMRRIAGSIFRVGMLMFGKPVTLLDLVRLIRSERSRPVQASRVLDTVETRRSGP